MPYVAASCHGPENSKRSRAGSPAAQCHQLATVRAYQDLLHGLNRKHVHISVRLATIIADFCVMHFFASWTCAFLVIGVQCALLMLYHIGQCWLNMAPPLIVASTPIVSTAAVGYHCLIDKIPTHDRFCLLV